MITRQGRVEVLNDPECRLFPWHPRPVLELSESNAVQLHEGPCLVLFVGEWTCFYGCSSTWGSAWSSLSVNEVAFYLEHIECQTMWKSVRSVLVFIRKQYGGAAKKQNVCEDNSCQS